MIKLLIIQKLFLIGVDRRRYISLVLKFDRLWRFFWHLIWCLIPTKTECFNGFQLLQQPLIMSLPNHRQLLANLSHWLQDNNALLTIAVLIGIQLLDNTPLEILNPTPVYLAAVVYAASSGGMRAGLVSAAMVVLYAITSFSAPDQLFHYTNDDFRRVLIIAIGTLAIALMVGNLKERLEYLTQRHRAAEMEIQHLQAELERWQNQQANQ